MHVGEADGREEVVSGCHVGVLIIDQERGFFALVGSRAVCRLINSPKR